MAIAFSEDDLKHIDPAIAATFPKIEFWRTAARSGFSDAFFKSMSGNLENDKWFKRLDFESNNSYQRRGMFIEDPGLSKKIIQTFKGFASRVKVQIDTGLNEEIDELFNANIDSRNNSFEHLMGLAYEELLTVGQTYVAVDTNTLFNESGEVVSALPYAYIIPRECVLDFDRDELTGEFIFIKFKFFFTKSVGITKVHSTRIIIAHREEYIITEEDPKTGKFVEVLRVPNQLGVVPICQMNMGTDATPIINTVAKYQLDIMNFQSEMRNTLSIQGINLLGVPNHVDVSVLKANSVLKWEDGYTGLAPQWIAPPSNTLDPHFRYLDWLVQSLMSMANMNRKMTNQAESAEAKQLDFLDTEAILNTASTEIEECFKDIIRWFGMFTDQSVEPTFEIDRKFVSEDLTMLVDNALKAQLLDIGATAMAATRKRIRDLITELDPDSKNKSDNEIEQIVDTLTAPNNEVQTITELEGETDE